MVPVRDGAHPALAMAQPPLCWVRRLLMPLLNSVVGDETAVCRPGKSHKNTDFGAMSPQTL